LPDSLSGLVIDCLRLNPGERLDDVSRATAALESAAHALGTTRSDPPSIQRTDNLPAAISSFIGRKDVSARVDRLIGVNRLVTLTGPGGAGKTRLSIEVGGAARPRFDAGVWVVELAPLAQPDLVVQEVASVLRVREQPGVTLLEGVEAAISSKPMLLVLDNCEHVLPGCAALTRQLLAQCANLHILATSREKLGITGEIVFQVPTLELPPESASGPDELASIESVQLFIERANAESGGFELNEDTAAAVASICRRLDGIPLALELAAARVGTLSVGEISARLGDRFRLLTHGDKTAISQHQTLSSLIDWSYDLLTASEQELLCALSIFPGSWTLDAVEQICAKEDSDPGEILDLHSRLVDKSLVQVDTEAAQNTGSTRFRLLDTIHSYAVEHRAAGESWDRIRSRHGACYLSFAEDTLSNMRGSDRTTWFGLWKAESENFRQSLDTFAETGEDALGLRLAGALGEFWDMRGLYTHGREVLVELLSRPGNQAPDANRALALQWAGYLAYRQQSYAEAEERMTQCLAIREKLGDDQGLAWAHNSLAGLAKAMGDSKRARPHHKKSIEIWRRIGDEERLARALANYGNQAIHEKDFDLARALLTEGLALARKTRGTEVLICNLHHHGLLAIADERFEDARRFLDESFGIAASVGEPHELSLQLHDQGRLAERIGDFETAHSCQAQSLKYRWELRDRFCSARSILAFGVLAARTGKLERAARLFGASEAILEAINSRLSSYYQMERSSSLDRLRSELSPEVFDREWSSGVAMSVDEAVNYAIDAGA
jgi:non-specific serine/threonine protein kinase